MKKHFAITRLRAKLTRMLAEYEAICLLFFQHNALSDVRAIAARIEHSSKRDLQQQTKRKCCNFENGDGGGPERSWAAKSQAARSNSWSMN